jgi:hypothetical protein
VSTHLILPNPYAMSALPPAPARSTDAGNLDLQSRPQAMPRLDLSITDPPLPPRLTLCSTTICGTLLHPARRQHRRDPRTRPPKFLFSIKPQNPVALLRKVLQPRRPLLPRPWHQGEYFIFPPSQSPSSAQRRRLLIRYPPPS